MLFKAGDQEPKIPLVEVVGKTFKLAPEHMEATASNDGTMLGFTTIVKLALAAHCPAFGVNI